MDLGEQALSGIFPKNGEPDSPKAPLVLVKCDSSHNAKACGLVQLKHSVSPDLMYIGSYGYRSGINSTMREHLHDIVRTTLKKVHLENNDIVLDIGSNDGTLLKGYYNKNIRRIGIDPGGEQYQKYYPDDIVLVKDFFSAKNFETSFPGKKAKIITSIAMFYDLEDPLEFVRSIRQILHKEGVWVLEQSYLPTMLAMNSFDTVCHEHLEYYSFHQIEWMLKKCGLKAIDIDFNDTNGGSFRITVAHESSEYPSDSKIIEKTISDEDRLELTTTKPYREFCERVDHIGKELNDFLRKEKAKGKTIFIYGASTKGNVLLQYFKIDTSLITAAADRNTEKFGCRTPGTGIPIISEEDARKMKPDYFLVLPWHFRKEFIEREAEFLKSGGKFIFPLPKLEIV